MENKKWAINSLLVGGMAVLGLLGSQLNSVSAVEGESVPDAVQEDREAHFEWMQERMEETGHGHRNANGMPGHMGQRSNSRARGRMWNRPSAEDLEQRGFDTDRRSKMWEDSEMTDHMRKEGRNFHPMHRGMRSNVHCLSDEEMREWMENRFENDELKIEEDAE